MDFELDLEELFDSLNENVKKDVKDFNDIVNLDGCLKREIYIIGSVDGLGSTIDGYIRFWNNWDAKHEIPVKERKPIKIYIDSVGGSITDALTIMDSIKLSKTPVWTIGIGKVWSSGFEIFYMGHKRLCYPHANFLWHEGSIGTNNVDAHKFRNYADFYDKQLEQFKEMLLSNTKITEEFFDKNRKDDVWMFADEAIELGVADEIVKELV